MNVTLAAYALGTVALVSLMAGFLGGRRFAREKFAGPIQNFVLANRELEQRSIVQLLLSTSFSLNGMLYQIWLGYTIGIWALAVQAAWALSYPWLGHFVDRVREESSLHAFLGKHFGTWTRILAATCSIVGFGILIGWEFNVGRSIFAGLWSHTQASAEFLTYFMIAIVLVSVLYTALGGLGGDAYADTIQNVVKALIFMGVGAVMYLGVRSAPETGTALWHRAFPPLSVAIVAIGLFGFITNVAFSIVWQFVDMSAWQSVIGSKDKLSRSRARSALWQSGLAVFIAPGVIGTALGILVKSATTINSDNIMSVLIGELPASPPLAFVVYVALIATIMSMVDGVLLAAAYSFVCDILYHQSTLEALDSDERKADLVLTWMRLVLAVVALAGCFGVLYLLDIGISLFNITYVLVICQLALVGPIFRAFGSEPSLIGDKMVLAIIAGLLVGFSSFYFGAKWNSDTLLTGAGFFTIVASSAVAFCLPRRKTAGVAA